MTTDSDPARRPPEPGLELIVRLDATLAEPIDLGMTPAGHRRIVPITGGSLSGPMLNGRVVPGGADWQIIHPDGWVGVEARYAVQADDGTPISVTSRGVRHGPPEVMRRLMSGESPDPSTYRFRTAVDFEVAETSPHGWLNHIVAIASAIRDPAAVRIDIHRVT